MQIEQLAQPFGVFSESWNIWVENSLIRDLLITANAVACASIIPAAIFLMHFTRRRRTRLAYGLLSFGAFGYLVGVLTGEFVVVSPISTVFHIGMALAVWAAAPALRERNALRESQSDSGLEVGESGRRASAPH